MRVNVAHSPPPSPSSSLSPHSSQTALPCSTRLHRSTSTLILPHRPKPPSHHHLRRSCSASFDGHDFPHHHHYPIDHFTPKPKPTTRTTSFLSHVDTHVDLLEPSLLGIRPEPPDWPARDAVIRDCIARRASSIEIPLSLKMIKMKQKFLRLEEERDIDININELNSVENNNDPMSNLCCSTLYIIRELQREALKSRGLMFDEELDDGIVSKVQREMTSSFVWLFKEFFAKTPDMMLQVMVVTSTFATHSLESLNLLEVKEEGSLGNWGGGYLGLGKLEVPKRDVLKEMDESEVGLWNSMVVEAGEMKDGLGLDQGLGFVVDRDDVDHDHDDQISGLMEEKKSIEFVSPVRIEIEKDDYEEYHKTDLLYQIGLFQEPNNTLLLSNYAQFLCLVSRDYDRAEECFKRAILLDPTDAEVTSLYANFLWMVRKDLWGAEERFQQAMAAEPDNSYHASKYASFLWSTGGDDTCYPLEPPRGKS